MIIKICGMREPENIRAVNSLGVDLIGFVFDKSSPRYVPLVNSQAGIIPDRVDATTRSSISNAGVLFVGVFANEMPQTVITNIYNFNLDYVQLDGEESSIYIDNLRATVVPDIRTGLKIIKTIHISSREDIAKAEQYEHHADMLLFDFQRPSNNVGPADWSVLEAYEGTLPFMLSGSIGPDDAEKVKSFRHPMFAGVNLNDEFEISPALKNVESVKTFIERVGEE